MQHEATGEHESRHDEVKAAGDASLDGASIPTCSSATSVTAAESVTAGGDLPLSSSSASSSTTSIAVDVNINDTNKSVVVIQFPPESDSDVPISSLSRLSVPLLADSVYDHVPVSLSMPTARTCRICLESSTESPELADTLISPCLCSGTSAFVHRGCLDHWRSTNVDSRAFHQCTTCGFVYSIVEDTEGGGKRKWKRMKTWRTCVYYSYVGRDLLVAFAGIQAVVISLLLVMYHLDSKRVIPNFFPEHNYNSQHPSQPELHASSSSSSSSLNLYVLYYYASALLLLALIGIIGWLSIWFELRSHALVVRDADVPCICCSIAMPLSCILCRGWIAPGSDKNSIASLLLLVVLSIISVLAVVGVLIGVIVSVTYVHRVLERHKDKIWRKVEVEWFPVEDFQGREEELERVREERKKRAGESRSRGMDRDRNRSQRTSESAEHDGGGGRGSGRESWPTSESDMDDVVVEAERGSERRPLLEGYDRVAHEDAYPGWAARTEAYREYDEQERKRAHP